MKIVVTTAGPEPPARLYGLVLIREKFIKDFIKTIPRPCLLPATPDGKM